MTAVDELVNAAAALLLDRQPQRRLDEIAADAIVEGHDGPAMVELAIQGPEGTPTLEQVGAALAEVGVDMPSERDARCSEARLVARRIVEGAVEPYVGAAEIWWELAMRNDLVIDELLPFVGDASDWEDLPGRRTEIEASILANARRLLADST